MGLALVMASSCAKKKTDTIIITKKPAPAARKPTIHKMGDYTQTRPVAWMGNKYTVESSLAADDSLPLASDGATRYYDNRIRLRIVRADGSEFFSRSFTKSFFRDYVDDASYRDGALLGIVFVRASGNRLLFAASVGNPDKSSDEYVPLVLRIDNFGNVTVSKDTRLDTESDTQQDDEDDGV